MTLRERLGFAVGGFGQNLLYNWVALYLLAYLYDGLALSPRGIATLTVILTAARIWDAVNDLAIGVLVDRTRTRWGTFRPWIIVTALPIAVLTTLLFSIPEGDESRKLVIIGIAYVLWDAVYTSSDVPYWSLTTVITTDDESRSRLVSWARAASMIALAIVTLVGAPLAIALSGGGARVTAEGWSRATLLVAGVGMALFTVAFFATREKVRHRPEPLPVRQALRQIFANKPLGRILLGGILSFGQLLIQVGGAVVASIVFGDVAAFTILGGALIGGMIIATFITPIALRRLTRRLLIIVVNLGLAATYLALWAVGFRSLMTVAAVFFIGGLFQGGRVVTETMLIGDAADWGELQTGDRVDGACFAGLTFITKLGSALATLVFGSIITGIGYSAGVEVTEAMRSGLWSALTLAAAGSSVLACLPMLRYAVPERDLKALLAQKRALSDSPAPS